MKDIKVVIPNFEYRYTVANKSRKSGRKRYWTVNGQGLYNATLHYRLRSKITKYYHKYLSKYIKKQISKEQIIELNNLVFPGSSLKLSISLEIHEVRRGSMPDVSNLWLWIKWFEDALQESRIIPDDDPDHVQESGCVRYYFVDNIEQRQLVFTLRLININVNQKNQIS
jgi:hypothetical protein